MGFQMARKPRIEFSNAIYHIINRGNYRDDIFATDGARRSFEDTLIEASRRCEWVVHAYCLMRNHFHFALETPRGNLVEGMQWLQATYANRFNRFRREQGHLFQGRYKSLLVEPGENLLRIVNYIHLNPVRASLISFKNLPNYRWSSYYWFSQRTQPACLRRADWLITRSFPDTRKGWRQYQRYLELQMTDDPGVRQKLDRQMCRGWIIGETQYKRKLAEELEKMQRVQSWGRLEMRELNEFNWAALRAQCLKMLDKSDADVLADKKSERWKIAVACWMKTNSSVSNVWLGRNLGMGASSAVSRNVAAFQRSFPRRSPIYRKIESEMSKRST